MYVLKTSASTWETPLHPIPVHDLEPFMREIEERGEALAVGALGEQA